ncbi:hypothetical protein HOY82DRAFT_494792, partial [Tuber indicum]
LSDFGSGHLQEERLQFFTTKVLAKGAPWSFIDSTIREVYWPTVSQYMVYNKHKKFHALKYSAGKIPDSLIYHL